MAKRSPKSDPQRAKVYAAEHTFGRRARYDIGMTLPQARKVAAEVCSLYDVPPIKIRYEKAPRERHGAVMVWDHNEREYCNPVMIVNSAHNKLDILILLHELAHWIDAVVFGSRESHGANFVGISAWLYDRYFVMPAIAYRAMLDQKKIHYRQIGRCSPKALKRISRVAP